MVTSDPEDWAIWESIDREWTKLVDAELERRKGRGAQWYKDLLKLVDKRDLDLENLAGTSGSSTSNLTRMQAFERGYAPGW